MAELAFVVLIAWIVLVAGVRAWLQFRRTGQPTIHFRDQPGSAQWWARLISAVALFLAFAAPAADLGGLAPIEPLDEPIVALAGLVLALAGIAATVVAQAAMGDSWRADVDPDRRTELVTTGPFRFVRNPILSATALTLAGVTLMVPNVLAVTMVAVVLVAHQVQVRLVEEPYLLRTHGDAFRRYAARTGRFVPVVGKLRPPG